MAAPESPSAISTVVICAAGGKLGYSSAGGSQGEMMSRQPSDERLREFVEKLSGPIGRIVIPVCDDDDIKSKAGDEAIAILRELLEEAIEDYFRDHWLTT